MPAASDAPPVTANPVTEPARPSPASDGTTVLRVALPVPLPQVFDYAPPAGTRATAALVGCRVQVPFGSRALVGVVVEVGPAQPPEGGEPAPDAAAGTARVRPALREASAVLDTAPLLDGELLASLRWLSRYTHAPLGETVATALPASLRRGEPLPDTRAWGWRLTEDGATRHASLRAGSRPRRFAELLLPQPRDEAALDDALPGWRSAARTLTARGLAERIAIDPATLAPQPAPGPTPNAEQQAAIAAIAACNGFAALLLDGVTGSGKTEVYLQAIAACLARGRQALVLVPEIGLTPQMLARFRARLGVPVHALHSGLNDGERAHAWTAALRGEAQVLVGTRSAVFVPLTRPGLIVVDEEHDASYKQQDGIRYHARDFALVRGKALDVPVLLGSATPSLESLHNARSGRYAHLRLQRRAGDAVAPSVRVVDVRKRPLQAGLSPELSGALRAALDAGGQALVFKNRRGYAPVLLCHDCGWSAQCARCGTPDHGQPMTVHGAGRRLQCHHCGARRPVPLACPDCGSLALQPQGNGTERIEEVLKQQCADVPVLRIDRGSTRRRDALEQHLTGFGTAPGVLVGTQMLAKGHDLPNLTLVAVVGVDEGLFSADFRAGEKLAQLLIQVAGRAGRADKRGEVLLQTHHPDHPLLGTLLRGGYHAFAEVELAQRDAAGFPPFASLALLRADAKHADAPMQFLNAARALLLAHADAASKPAAARDPITSAPLRRDDAREARDTRTPSSAPPTSPQALHRAAAGSTLQIASPMPAPMARRAGMHRAQLLIAALQRRALHAALDAVVPALYALPEARRVRWSLDVDPVDLY